MKPSDRPLEIAELAAPDACKASQQLIAHQIKEHTAAAVAEATAQHITEYGKVFERCQQLKAEIAELKAHMGETGEPQTRFVLNDQQWDELAEILNAPATRNERLAALLSGRMGETERKG